MNINKTLIALALGFAAFAAHAQSYNVDDAQAHAYVKAGLAKEAFPTAIRQEGNVWVLYNETNTKAVGRWSSEATARTAHECYARFISARTMDEWVAANADWEAMLKMQALSPVATETEAETDL